MSAYLRFSADHVTNIDQDREVFFQVFVATDNSLCQLFHCSAVNLLNDIIREYNVHTAGQLVNRVNYVFTAAEQCFVAHVIS